MVVEELRKTPLYQVHIDLGAKMVPFAGWLMPLQYEGILGEHEDVRTDVRKFDVSHMARLRFWGPETKTFLNRVFTNEVGTMQVGQARYGMLCNEKGEIIDDDLVYQTANGMGMVVNAAKRGEVLSWLGECAKLYDVGIEDVTDKTGLLALQGPRSPEVLARLAPTLNHEALRYYHFLENVEVGGTNVSLFSRTGYTGEDGFEFWTDNENCIKLWGQFGSIGHVKGAGLGARDTLRTEAGLPLGGHEISRVLNGRRINPLEAGLGRFVKLEKPFIGRDALLAVQEDIDHGRWDRKLVGFKARSSGRIPRPGMIILAGGRKIGDVTSGTFSPTLSSSVLRQGIGMGFVEVEYADVNNVVQIGDEVMERTFDIQVVPLPFVEIRAGRKRAA